MRTQETEKNFYGKHAIKERHCLPSIQIFFPASQCHLPLSLFFFFLVFSGHFIYLTAKMTFPKSRRTAENVFRH